MLKLEEHGAFSWKKYKKENRCCYFRGWLEFQGVIYLEDSFGDFFDIIKEKKVDFFLKEMNGNFSMIFETAEKLILICDRICSFPLFYGKKADGKLVVSDNLVEVSKEVGNGISKEQKEEFLACGLIKGNGTIYEGVYQLQGGQMLIYDKVTHNYDLKDYFLHVHKYNLKSTPEALVEQLDQVVLHTMQRLVKSISGRTIALFLSGGYDSKLIAVSLKRICYENVVCIALGSLDTKDVVVSEKIAKELGFRWVRIDVTKKYWKKLQDTGFMDFYYRKRVSNCGMPYLQGIVLKDLIQNGTVPADCVAITGNSGDVIEGNDVTHRFEAGKLYQKNDIINAIADRHFMLNGMKKSQEIIKSFDIDSYIKFKPKNKDGFTDEEAEEIVEFYNWRERQCKYVVNDVRNYDEIIGVEWRLPLWDNEMVDFWLSIPYELRYDRKLYYMYVKGEALPSANDKSVIRKGINIIKKLFGKGILFLYYPKSIINYLFSNDFYFVTYGLMRFSELMAVLHTTKGFREPHSQGIARAMMKYY